MAEGIREVEVVKDDAGNYVRVRLVFGPHYFVNLDRSAHGKITFAMGATHHGFKADASEISGELERIINEVRKAHPDKAVD